jgi:hypothetical protein
MDQIGRCACQCWIRRGARDAAHRQYLNFRITHHFNFSFNLYADVLVGLKWNHMVFHTVSHGLTETVIVLVTPPVFFVYGTPPPAISNVQHTPLS